MKISIVGALLVFFTVLTFGIGIIVAWPSSAADAPGRPLMEEMYVRLLDVKTEIMGVRHDYAALSARFSAYAKMVEQQNDRIDSLQKLIEGLTLGPIAGPMTHDLDKRVARIEAYVESDKALKLEMAWWFRTLGAAAVLWLVNQIWSRIKHHFRRRSSDGNSLRLSS